MLSGILKAVTSPVIDDARHDVDAGDAAERRNRRRARARTACCERAGELDAHVGYFASMMKPTKPRLLIDEVVLVAERVAFSSRASSSPAGPRR